MKIKVKDYNMDGDVMKPFVGRKGKDGKYRPIGQHDDDPGYDWCVEQCKKLKVFSNCEDECKDPLFRMGLKTATEGKRKSMSKEPFVATITEKELGY